MEDFVIEGNKLMINEGVESFEFDFKQNLKLRVRNKIEIVEFPASLRDFNCKINCSIFNNLEVVDLSKCSKLETINEGCFNYGKKDSIHKRHEIDVKLPKTLKSLGTRAFARVFLKSFNYEADTFTLGERCFNGSAIKDFKLKTTKGPVFIEDCAFADIHCETVIIEAPEAILGECCFSSSFDVQIVVFDCNLKTLPAETFCDCSFLDTVILPKSLKEVKREAFRDCWSIHTLLLPENIEFIDWTAFNESNERLEIRYLGKIWSARQFVELLKEQNELIKQGDTRTLREFFESKPNERETPEHKYTVKDNCLIIDEGAEVFESVFTGNFDFPINSIDTLVVPKSLRELLAEFRILQSLEKVVIPKDASLEVIGSHCFADCLSLREIDFPKSLKVIQNEAFYNTGFQKVELTIDDLIVDSFCFSSCVALESVTVRCSEISINNHCFSDCENLREVVFNCHLNTVPYIKNNPIEGLIRNRDTVAQALFDGCTNLKHLQLPENVKVIESEAFKMCRSLESIELPKSLRLLGMRAFEGCKSLVMLELPESVEKISDVVFLSNTDDNLVIKYASMLWGRDEFASLVNSYTQLALEFGICNSIESLVDLSRDVKKFDRRFSLKFNQYARMQYPEKFAVIDGSNATDYEETSLF